MARKRVEEKVGYGLCYCALDHANKRGTTWADFDESATELRERISANWNYRDGVYSIWLVINDVPRWVVERGGEK